jgi:hypothetical protein
MGGHFIILNPFFNRLNKWLYFQYVLSFWKGENPILTLCFQYVPRFGSFFENGQEGMLRMGWQWRRASSINPFLL